MASELGDHTRVQAMLQKGVPVGAETLAYGLGMACRNGHLEVVEALLQVCSRFVESI